MCTKSETLILELRSICKSYPSASGPVSVLSDVNFSMRKKEFVALIGPSGSGKSTLMEIIALLTKDFEGEYVLEGVETHALSQSKRRKLRNSTLVYVPQIPQLLEDLNIAYNLDLPLIYRNVSPRIRQQKRREILSFVGLDGVESKYPSELSGGEQQRVALARSLMLQPKLLLADEPTGNLDPANATQIISLFKQIQKLGTSVLMVTHDHNLLKSCDRVLQLKNQGVCEI